MRRSFGDALSCLVDLGLKIIVEQITTDIDRKILISYGVEALNHTGLQSNSKGHFVLMAQVFELGISHVYISLMSVFVDAISDLLHYFFVILLECKIQRSCISVEIVFAAVERTLALQRSLHG